MKRFLTSDNRCPICDGFEKSLRGQGTRCTGFLSTDGKYVHCTRENFAGGIRAKENIGGEPTYPHLLVGECDCGKVHNPDLKQDKVRSIRTSPRVTNVATYDYVDASGELVYQVIRQEPKNFPQRRPDGAGGWIWNLQGVAPLLYRFPEVLAGVDAGDPIYICEGEKDVDAMRAAGCVATCNSGGAGKFQSAHSRSLRGADVVIVQDKDEKGRAHARDVVGKLGLLAKTVRIVEAKEGKDASDHLAAGLSVSDFVHVWPQGDPVAERKKLVLLCSFDDGDPIERVDMSEQLRRPPMPRWSSTLLHPEIRELEYFEGVTILAGGPGAGKSFLAIASSIEAALDGWDVFYLSAEMDPAIPTRRAFNRNGILPPDTWQLFNVKYGASAQSIINLLSENVTRRDTLVVFDSVSSFIDQGKHADSKDAHGIRALKDLLIWTINVRRASEGKISFLVLSELNKEGRTKGLFGDHKADRVLSMRSSQALNLAKEIEITKGWESQVGTPVTYLLTPGRCRFARMEEIEDAERRDSTAADASRLRPAREPQRSFVD